MKRVGLFTAFFLFLAVTAWAKVIKVAVLPFKINAPQDLSYVQEGLQDMLTTRLFVPGKVTVVEPEEVQLVLKAFKGQLTIEKAREIGRRLGADYVLWGSLTTFGHRVSLDAELIPVKADKLPVPLYTQVPDLDDLIPRLSDLAQKAVAALQGRPPMESASGVLESKAAASLVTPKASPKVTRPMISTSPSQMHPERLFRTELEPARSEARARPGVQTPKETQAVTPEPEEKRYKYSDIDSWPDYPPEEKTPGKSQAQLSSKTVKKKKKKHFWSKLLPWNWFRKKEEPELRKEPIIPPPPPPPPAIGTTREAPVGSGAPSASQTRSNPEPKTAASSSETTSSSPKKDTWQWY